LDHAADRAAQRAEGHVAGTGSSDWNALGQHLHSAGKRWRPEHAWALQACHYDPLHLSTHGPYKPSTMTPFT
ncbi:hypothetical protein CYMTET_33525, partial [Cymbomonas tetramitiformis]